jgi:DNA-binding GntR family transcriptional regulator
MIPDDDFALHNDEDGQYAELEWFLVHGFDNVHIRPEHRRRYLTKSQAAYVRLRRSIVTHTLPDSIPLDEMTLLNLFPFGRTPLREALKQLSFEGLLHWPPRQAPSIRDISMQEMRTLYETRYHIEPEIAALAASRATEEDLVRINALREKLIDASRRGHVYESVELDYALHAAIAESTQNRFLAEANNNLNLQSLRLWFRAQQGLGVSSIHLSHSHLVEAIRRHDAETARQLAQGHVLSSRERQQILLESASVTSTNAYSASGTT